MGVSLLPPLLSFQTLFALIFLLFYTQVLGTLDAHSEALLGLKSEILDPSNSLYDWSATSEQNPNLKISSCSWSGIICGSNGSKIVGLNLSKKNLSGSFSGNYFKALTDLLDVNLSSNSFSGQLPAEIFTLTNLKSLDISLNNFSGQFPHGISSLQLLIVLDAFSNSFSGGLSPELAGLSSLKVLNLAGSYFEGSIPKEFGSFKSLEFLHLAGNLLNGEIPPEFGNLQTVIHMEIGYNFYHGSIPPAFGNMGQLKYLDIAQANLSSHLPAVLSNLTNLESLFLFRNQLSGPIPPSFGNMTSLVNLDLSDNLLSGPIPATFSRLKKLHLLSLMYNYMNGSVPEGISELPFLDALFIWNNFFTGLLPQSLGKNSQLKLVDVSTNSFTGKVPSGLCSGGKLLKLMLFSNRFTDGLSSALTNCSSLVRLRVEDNLFSGEIPLKGNLLMNLTYVDLSRNGFTGGIPFEIAQAVNLQYFNISNNPNLGGSVSAKFWSLPHLQNFSASLCNLSGNLPSFESCKFISVVELSSNNLSGVIPSYLSNCRYLERMDLGDNQFTGQIPPKLASLPRLSLINLSHNKLSGPIPENFGNSTSLSLLNVSFNQISGSIPSVETFRRMDPGAFMGNPLLCGPPLQHCLNSKAVPHVTGFGIGNKSTGKLLWVLSLCSLVILLLVFGALYLIQRNKIHWKFVSFTGLPLFKPKDVLRSLGYNESPSKVVLPTGITVAVRKINWEENRRRVISEFLTLIGNARHVNLIRLLGFCSNNQGAYLLYDYLPNGNLLEKMKMKGDSSISNWSAKYKIVTGIARGLCYLHHDCRPPIPHGDLRASKVIFDENMEAHLAEFGLKYLQQINEGWVPRRISGSGKENGTREEIYRDVYSFGEIVLEILTNGKLQSGGQIVQSKPRETFLKEIYDENEVGPSESHREEIKQVLDIALLCTRSLPSDRPSMEDILRLLSGLRPHKSIADFAKTDSSNRLCLID